MRPFSHYRYLHLASLSIAAFIAIATSGCRTIDKTPQHSNLEGFSANNTTLTKNAAVMMTAYGSTPGNAGMFEQDQANMYAVLSDTKANYRFDINRVSQVGHQQMGDLISRAATKVSGDGTLLVFITAHGAPNGYIQPADQGYATFGYENIMSSIRAGRNGRGPFQRLVIVISACYSGSWLNTLSRSDDVAKQRLVITSVDAGNLSMIGSATSAVYQAFNAMKSNSNTTMSQFLATAQSYSGGMLQYNVNDNSILNESFINNPIDLKDVHDNDIGVKLTAVTTHDGPKGKLYLYASKDITSLFFIDGSDKPYECNLRAKAQTDWPFICVIQLQDNSKYLKDTEPLSGLFSYEGKTYRDDIKIQHVE